MIIEVPAILTSMSLTKDKGLRMGFTTQELTDEQKFTCQKFHQTFGYLLFKPNEFKESEVPKGNAVKKGKTPSQQLRNLIYIYWQKSGCPGDNQAFYIDIIDKLKEMIQTKINLLD
jgi:hypothetical protein